MAISKTTLSEMNDLLSKGKTIAQIADIYSDYGYWEIYSQVNDRSFLGKKRVATNRLKELVSTQKKVDRQEIVNEIQYLLDDLYYAFKNNSNKLAEIEKALGK